MAKFNINPLKVKKFFISKKNPNDTPLHQHKKKSLHLIKIKANFQNNFLLLKNFINFFILQKFPSQYKPLNLTQFNFNYQVENHSKNSNYPTKN